MKLFNLVLIFSLILSCARSTEDEPVINIFDPETPGQNNNNPSNVLPLTQIRVDSSVIGQLTFEWDIPANYTEVQYHISIMKTFADTIGEQIQISDPGTEIGAFTFEVAKIKNGNQFVDLDISPGQDYYYWFFINLNGVDTRKSTEGNWSTSEKFYLIAPVAGNNISVPNATDFWENISWSNILVKKDQETLINSFEEQSSTKSLPKGRVRNFPEYGLTFIMDKHRILMLENASIKNCNQISDELAKNLCLASAKTTPPSIKNVFGQVDIYSNKSCQEYNNDCSLLLSKNDCENNNMCNWNLSNLTCEVKGSDCLTHPTDVLINNNKMYIVDSGNHRIKIKDSVPEYGCDIEVFPNRITPSQCSFDSVIGKKDLNDFVEYDISQGFSSLLYPTSIDISDGLIVIADSGNDRVVWKSNISDPQFYECSDTNWQTSLCGWDGVLGQPNFTTSENFEDLFNSDNSILGNFFYNELTFEVDWFKRHFRNPKKVKFFTENDERKLIVSSNENFNFLTPLNLQVSLQARMLFFDNNVFTDCNAISYNLGDCDSYYTLGQESFDQILVLSGSNNNESSYNSVNYGLFDVNDFIIFDNNKILAIDSFANEIYYWDNFLSMIEGQPPTSRIENPNGRIDPISNIVFPDLKNLSGIDLDESSGQLFITDSLDGKLYLLNLFNSL